MLSSILLARFFGILMIIVYGGVLINRKHYHNLFRKLDDHPHVMLLSGIVALVIGLVALLTHNVWASWAVVITLVAWLFALSGALRIAFPKTAATLISWFTDKDNVITFYVTISAMTAIGVFLAVMGFMS